MNPVPNRGSRTCGIEEKGEEGFGILFGGSADCDGSFHPRMKETSEIVRSSVEGAGVECPGLSWDQCLVEDAVADWNNQCLEALVDWDGDGVATERMGKQPVVGDWDLCAFLDLDVLW